MELVIGPITLCSTRLAPPCWHQTPPVAPEIAKTHNGLISAFSLHLVKPGRVPVELGKALNKTEELRLMADYKGDPVEEEDAAWAVS